MGQGRFKAWSRVAVAFLVAAGASAVAYRGALAREADAVSRRFDLTVSTGLKIQTTGTGAVRVLDAWSQLNYEVAHRAREMDVSIHSLEIRLKENGKETLNSRMSRAGIVTKRGGSSEEDDYEDQAPSMQQRLRCFDTTAVTVAFDASGKELKRTAKIEGPLAEQIGGLIESLLAIHVGFPREADRWEVPARLTMGQGRTAQGTLRFEKVSREGKTVRMRVAGRLVPTGGGAKSEETRTGSYSVSGEQVYDTAAQQWRSADWSIELSLDVLQNGKPAGAASGSMKLTVRPAIPEEAADPEE